MPRYQISWSVAGCTQWVEHISRDGSLDSAISAVLKLLLSGRELIAVQYSHKSSTLTHLWRYAWQGQQRPAFHIYHTMCVLHMDMSLAYVLLKRLKMVWRYYIHYTASLIVYKSHIDIIRFTATGCIIIFFSNKAVYSTTYYIATQMVQQCQCVQYATLYNAKVSGKAPNHMTYDHPSCCRVIYADKILFPHISIEKP